MDAAAQPQPQVAILGGINGAGKTTASQRILRDAMRIPVFTNADAIARGLNAFDPESEAVQAGRVMLTHMHAMVAARRSFAFETTLAARTYARWLAELKQAGLCRSPVLLTGSKAPIRRSGGLQNESGAADISSLMKQSGGDIPGACETFSNSIDP